MRSRQARKIVRMVKYIPIDRMSSTWFDRALQWCATYRQPQIKKALRYYWNGVADGKMLEEVAAKIENLKKKGFAIISPEFYKQGDEGRQFEMMLPLLGLGVSV